MSSGTFRKNVLKGIKCSVKYNWLKLTYISDDPGKVFIVIVVR